MRKRRATYKNAFLDALAGASRSEFERFRKSQESQEVLVVVKDGMVALRPWRPGSKKKKRER